MHNSNFQSIKSRFESYSDVPTNKTSQQLLPHQNFDKYVLRRSATSMGPLRESKQSNKQITIPNYPKFNIQRSSTSLDILNTSTINRNLKYTVEKAIPAKSVCTEDIKLTNKPVSVNKYGVLEGKERSDFHLKQLNNELNNISYCSDSSVCTNSQNGTNKSVVLSRQLSDPLKKGNIKRSPAFRCERPLVKDNANIKSNLSNRIKMFEENQTKNKTTHILKVPPDRIKMACKSPMQQSSSTKYISTNSPKKNRLKPNTIVSSEKNDESKNIQTSKHRNGVINSLTKYKSNQVLKKELETITKRKIEYSSQLITRDELQGDSEMGLNFHSSRSSSRSPSCAPIKLIPEYAQVIKPKPSQRNLTTFSKRVPENIIKKNSSAELSDNLTDTLKKALKSPLPNGPPPKKPPRTFAHSPVSSKSITKDIENDVPCNISTNKSINDKRAKHTKNDPKLMLAKLEHALLNNKIKSPKVSRKILNISGPTNVTHTPFPNMPKTDLIPTQNKSTSEIKYNILDDTSSFDLINKPFFSECFPINCTQTNYVDVENTAKSKSLFFVECQATKPDIKSAAHIYAEPFEFQKKVPDESDMCYESNMCDRINAELGNKTAIFSKFEKGIDVGSSRQVLHYLCTPIRNPENAYEEISSETFMNEKIPVRSVNVLNVVDDQKINKNVLFDDKLTREKVSK